MQVTKFYNTLHGYGRGTKYFSYLILHLIELILLKFSITIFENFELVIVVLHIKHEYAQTKYMYIYTNKIICAMHGYTISNKDE